MGLRETRIFIICEDGMKKVKERYLVTGATGYVGRHICRRLLAEGHVVSVIARDKKRISDIEDSGINGKVYETDITDTCGMENVGGTFDYIIHCAAVTRSDIMISNPVEVADGIVIGTRNVLELAKRCGTKSVVYISSMEVYGKVKDTGKPVTENILGDVDILSARSCYPLGKRMAEQYCYGYYAQYKVPVKIARLAQTFGKGTDKNDTRVFMQFAKAAKYGKDTVLKTRGMSYGNYCGIEDTVEGILVILREGEDGQAYNVVNEDNTMRIRDMAELVAGSLPRVEDGQDGIRVIYDIEDNSKTGYAPDTELRLSSEKLRGLGWKPEKKLIQMYRDILEEL